MINLAVGALAILGSLAGTAKWIEGHYETRAHVAQMRSDDERSRIQSDIDLYQLKIDYLQDKIVKTPEDQQEIEYLKGLVAKLRDRLKNIDS